MIYTLNKIMSLVLSLTESFSCLWGNFRDVEVASKWYSFIVVKTNMIKECSILDMTDLRLSMAGFESSFSVSVFFCAPHVPQLQ